jgi:hypothetical protein
LFIASAASAAPLAHQICLKTATGTGFSFVLGVNLSDSACAALGGIANLSFDNAPPGGTGPQGPVGATGPTGVAGPTGGTGGTGGSGAVGNPGPQGVQGPTGGTGQTGGTGGTGPIGGSGIAGLTGNQGLIGQDGPQGNQGIPGGVGPVGPSGGAAPVILVTGPVQAPVTGGGTFAGNFTVASVATCPAGTSILGGGGHIGLSQGTSGALNATYPSGNSWVAGAVVTHAAPSGTITGQAFAFCQ